MAAQRRGGFLLRGGGVEGGVVDGHGAPIDALAHELVVEGARAFGRIDAAEVIGQRAVARHGDAVSALLPEQELEQPLDVAVVDFDGGAFVGQRGGAEYRDRTVAAFQREGQGPAAADLLQ